MLTPSGRFDPGAKICLSMSDFHPESWNPLWGVSMILLGLQSFFYEGVSTTGAVHGATKAEKRRLAARSLEFNARNPTYRKLFPELVELAAQRAAEAAAAPPPAEGAVAEADEEEEPPRPGLGVRELALGAAVLAAAVGLALLALQEP